MRDEFEKAQSEEEVRNAVALPGCSWEYLRFAHKNSTWTPAAGTFAGWPKTARALSCLDPCMGSGHFVVAMFERLVALRMAEEKLDEATAAAAVIRDNLFGLEIDPRCTQIGAFNLALAAWRRVGHCTLPAMNLACSGLAPNAKKEDWLKLAAETPSLRFAMAALYDLFEKAPFLGSLIDPRRDKAVSFSASLEKLQPLLEKALAQETNDDTAHEMAVTARGLAKAAEILAGQFTLIATNVPYLGRGKQDETLMDYCERVHPEAKADLATCFVERCLSFCSLGGSAVVVTPQNWLFLGTYKKLRQRVLSKTEWELVIRLGEHAFESPQAAGAFVALVGLTHNTPPTGISFYGLDASSAPLPKDKADVLLTAPGGLFGQEDQLEQPDCRIVFGDLNSGVPQLSTFAECYQGVRTGDRERFIVSFWEVTAFNHCWMPFRNSSDCPDSYSGLCEAIRWEDGKGQLHEYAAETRDKLHDMHESGNRGWGRLGVAINQMRKLAAYHYLGERYDGNVNVIVPSKSVHLIPIWCFCSSPEYELAVRRLDQKLNVTNATLIKVPFDLTHWQKVAAEKYPQGLPKPFSSDPTQWLFSGHPRGSDEPLHVAVARLLGYQWPRQTGANFPDCPALDPDGLEKLADEDGIVCLSATKGKAPAAERLRACLVQALGKFDLNALIASAGPKGSQSETLEEWLRDEFFDQHCALFQHRPFIWHLWDGHNSGFSALVNYHKLTHSNLETLSYAYLGDWIRRQQAAVEAGEAGSDARLQAAKHLQARLKLIIEGEPPYDLFVRWKPLSQQAIGWHPDINDGVRMNIRPFVTADILRKRVKIKWEKDRGKESARDKKDFPWFWGWDGETQDFAGISGESDGNRWNDCHYTSEFKRKAREG